MHYVGVEYCSPIKHSRPNKPGGRPSFFFCQDIVSFFFLKKIYYRMFELMRDEFQLCLVILMRGKKFNCKFVN